MPNRSDVDRVERDLLAPLRLPLRRDDRHVRRPVRAARRRRSRNGVRSSPTRSAALVVRRALGDVSLNGLEQSAADGRLRRRRSSRMLGELESGLLDPERSRRRARGPLRRLPRRARPARPSGTATSQRRRAVERLQNDLDAWHGEPVFAYGFEDLTGAEWALLEALAGRAEVSVSLPYEPGRVAFASLRAHRERPRGARATAASRSSRRAPPSTQHPALAHLERALFDESPPPPPELDGAVRFLEGAGARGTLELVGDEVLAADPRRDAARADRARRAVARNAGARRSRRCSASLGVPYAIESRPRLGSTPLGHALLQLLRFAWADGGRRELFAFLRSPYSGLARSSVDFVEGRLRGRAIHTPARVEEEAEKLRGGADPAARRASRRRASPTEAVARARGAMLRAAYGTRRAAGGRDVAARPARRTARSLRAARRARCVGGARRRAASATRCSRALERAEVRASRRRRGRPGRGRRPAARAHAPVRGRLRPRSRGGLAAAAPARLAVPRRRRAPRARRPARASRSGQPRPLPLLHGLHARDPAPLSRSRGGDRRRRRRASRARSGRRSRRCSTPRTWRARRRGGRSRR